MSLTILIPLMGGFGNQVFQFAAGKFIQQKLGRKIIFNPTLLQSEMMQNRFTKRDFEISEMIDTGDLSTKRLVLPKIKIQSLIFPNRIIWEKNPYDYALDRITEDTKLVIGYHQHAKIVESLWPEIKQDFMKHPLLRRSFLENVINQVAIHVRLSDNVTNAHSISYHGLTDRSYYFEAVESLMKSENFPEKVKIYTDSPNLVPTLIDDLKRKFNVKVSLNENPQTDFTEMSRSSHLIINNSSFSWWAGWFASKNFNAKIVYPKPWYGKAENKLLPIYVDSWTPLTRRYRTS